MLKKSINKLTDEIQIKIMKNNILKKNQEEMKNWVVNLEFQRRIFNGQRKIQNMEKIQKSLKMIKTKINYILQV